MRPQYVLVPRRVYTLSGRFAVILGPFGSVAVILGRIGSF
jgi:hypothetical protein